MTSKKPAEGARERILKVASDIFAESGFKAASVRKICERAGANAAMVNYYFRSKDELYIAVIDTAADTDRGLRDLLASDLSKAPQERLLVLIESMLVSLLIPGPGSALTRLISWELVEPTAALAHITDRLIRPLHQLMLALVGELSPSLAPEQRLHCVFSILGQVVLYNHSRAVHALLVPEMRYDADSIAKLARHICDFSLRGMGPANLSS